MATTKYVDINGLSRFKNNLQSLMQPTLISGTNIKTINNVPILGSGNIEIGGEQYSSTIITDGVTWTLRQSISTAGVIETNKATFATTDYIPVTAGMSIVYSGQTVDSNNNNFTCNYMLYDSSKKAVGTRQTLLSGGTLTSGRITQDGYIRLMFGRTSSTNINITSNDTLECIVEAIVAARIIFTNKNAKKICPCCDFISVPNEVVGADHWQALVKVGNEILLTQNSSTVGGTVNGIIDRISANDFSYIGKFNHNLGHLNCCDYDEQTDMMITGWASDNANDAKKLYVFRNVLSWTSLSTGSTLNYSNVNVTEIDMSSYLSTLSERSIVLGNAIWANRTSEGHRYVIVTVGNPTETFIKIMLGYGTNQRTYGTYTAAAEGVPNGTFDVIWVKTIDMPTIQGCTGVKTMINQDAKYYKGGILMALSAIPVTALWIYENNNSNKLGYDIIRSPWANDDGVTQTGWNQGVLIMNDDIYIGIAPTSSGSTNPNKLAKFRL